MTTLHQPVKGPAPKGSFRLSRWASDEDNTRRFLHYVERLKRAARHDVKALRMKRRWRDRVGYGGPVRVRRL